MKNFIRIGIFFITLLWFLGAMLPFFVQKINVMAYLLPYFDMLYDPVCHQIGSKKFCVDSVCSLVCSRCLGIYAGFSISSLLILFSNPVKFHKINLLFYASVPMLLDVIFTTSGIYEYSIYSASLSGFIFGYAAFYYFYKGIYQVIVPGNNRANSDKELKELN